MRTHRQTDRHNEANARKKNCRTYIGPPSCKNVTEIATQLGPRQSYSKALCLCVVTLILFQTGRWTESKQRMIHNQLQAFERKGFAEILVFGEQFHTLRSDAFVNRTPTDDMWQDALRLTGHKEYT